jgi:predicted Ser/Thr protein kinase
LDYVKDLDSSIWIDNADIEYTKKLGSGTGGKVYQGLFKGNDVAIKVLKDMTEEEQIEDFKKEFHIMW